jgi:hypothetical protein
MPTTLRSAYLSTSLFLSLAGCQAGLSGQAGAPAAGEARAAASPYTITERAETGPVTALAFRAPILYAGTAHGLRRWDVTNDEYEPMNAEAGLQGRGVTALGVDGERNVWVATEAGVGRLLPAVKGDKNADAHGWTYHAMGGLGGLTALAPMADGRGAWAGGRDGLFRSDGTSWSPVPELRNVGVTSLDLDADGKAAWVGTRAQGLFRAEGDHARPVIAGEALTALGGIVEMVGTARLASGTRVVGASGLGDAGGRLVFLEEGEPQAFRAQPEVRVVRVVDTGKDAVLVAGPAGAERAYSLQPLRSGEVPPDGSLRFVSVKKGTAAARARDRWAAVPLDELAPPGVTVAVGGEGAVYYGTQHLGVARGAKKRPAYLSGAELVGDAERMTVACASSRRCFVVTDGPHAWVTDGDTYRETRVGEGDDGTALAVVADRGGTIYALSSEPKYKGLMISRLAQASSAGAADSAKGDQWMSFHRAPLALPAGTQAAVGFAGISPEGVLWVGLRARPEGGDVSDEVGIGAVEIDLASRHLVQHTAAPPEKAGEKPAKGAEDVLPLPPALTGVFFDDGATWFSSQAGLFRWQQGELRNWGENEGLRSELTFGAARLTPDLLWAATSEGVARFDGKSWRMVGDSEEAIVATRGLVRDAAGGVWVATSKGLRHVAAADAAVGRAGDLVVAGDMHDVHLDRDGRVWALSSSSIALVTPVKK